MDKCADILKFGVFNEIVFEYGQNIEEKIEEWFTKITYEMYLEKKKQGLKFGTVFPVDLGSAGGSVPVGVDLDGEVSKAKFEEIQKSMKEGKYKHFTSSQVNTMVTNSVDKNIVNAWGTCMKECQKVEPSPDRPGIVSDISCKVDHDEAEAMSDIGLHSFLIDYGDHVVFKVRYNSPDGGYPKVESLHIQGASLIGKGLSPGDEIKPEYTMLFKRDHQKGLVIIIRTDRGTIEKMVSPKASPPLILKWFSYRTFSKNGEKKVLIENKVPEGFKIISGGSSVGFKRLYSSYPKSVREWVFYGESPVESSIDFNTILLTVYDPENEWDIRVFSNQVDNSVESTVVVPSDYTLVSGGVKFESPDNSTDPGITSCYPENNDTWKSGINTPEGTSWELISYAVAIKHRSYVKLPAFIRSTIVEDSRNAAESDLPTQPDRKEYMFKLSNFELKNGQFLLGGGIKFQKDENFNYQIGLMGHTPFERPFQGAGVFGWNGTWYYYDVKPTHSNPEFKTVATLYTIGVDTSEYPIQHLNPESIQQ